MKTCNRCKENKPIAEFHKNKANKDGHNNRCARCTVEYNNERYKKSDSMREYQKKYWTDNNRRLKKYGLSQLEYDKMLEEQDGRCKICKVVPEKWLYIDHCHKSGKVRGLLCLQCNTALGNFDDNIDRLQAAIVYLKNNMPR